MNFGFFFRFTCLLMLCFSCQLASAETFTVIAYQNANPPYNIRVKESEYGHKGIFFDIFARLDVLTGDRFVFRHYPVSRALKEFDQGLVDIEPGINLSWRQHRKEPGLYSIEYARSAEVVLFNKGKHILVNSAGDLYGKTLGVVRGYVYPLLTKAFTSGNIKRVDNVSEFYLLKQLEAKRYDQILIGLTTAQYYMKKELKYKHFEVGDFVSEVGVHMRVHPNKAYVLERLNGALEKMLNHGEIDAIYDKYR